MAGTPQFPIPVPHPQQKATGRATPRFTEEVKLPPSLENKFRESYWILTANPQQNNFTPALVAFSQVWLWLKTSSDGGAREIRELFARIHDDERQGAMSVGYGPDNKKELRHDGEGTSSPASKLARLEMRDVDLLAGLRTQQITMKMAAEESDAIRRLRTIVAPDNLEEVLNLVNLINL